MSYFRFGDILSKLKTEIHVTIYKCPCLLNDSIRYVSGEIPDIILYVVWAADEIPK